MEEKESINEGNKSNSVEEKLINQKEAEKYDKVSSVIDEIASRHPHIYSETITMLKGLYQGDSRPLSAIIEELEAFEARFIPVEPPVFSESSEDITSTLNSKDIQPLFHETWHADMMMPQEASPELVDSELSDMFAQDTSDYQSSKENYINKPKQYIKQNNYNQGLATSNTSSDEGGYADITTMSLLTTAAIFSIITILLAIATIM